MNPRDALFRDLYEVVAEGAVDGRREGLSLVVASHALRGADFDIADFCERQLADGFARQLGVAPDLVYWRVPGGD